MSTDIPVFACGDEKDERSDGVFLLSVSDGEKKTAEDCGEFWQIRDWEIMDVEGPHWFCSWSYSVSKDVIDILHAAGQAQ